jgi:alkylhydroperoxidase family enzyme
MMKLTSIALLASSLLLGSNCAMSIETAGFSPRLTAQRLAPIGKEGRTPEQEKMLASRPDYNIYKTLAQHPVLYAKWSPLGQYLLNGSTLPPRDREIVILRMGWLCQAPYEWSQHARIAQADVKMTAAEVHRIAEGANAKGWTDFERVLISMVDEIRYDTKISDKTWNALRAKYSLEQTIDAMYTATQYQLVSMALNSLGVQLDPILADRIPTDVKTPRVAGMPASPRLTTPRVKPLPLSELSGERLELVKPRIRDGMLPNLYATLINHPKLYGPRSTFGTYIQRESLVPPQTRELLIMRTGWLIRTEYEWAHHAPIAKEAGLTDAEIARIAEGASAKGWNEDQRAVLQAVDELLRETFISDATWKTLAKYYSKEQMIEIVYTVGAYAMTGTAINSLGIQLEAGYQGFPRH